MVCAPQPEAVETGVDILRAGGNAVDAAIACAFTQGVVDPLMCGVAGFGSMGVYLPGRTHEYLDFHAPAPRAATPGMWEDLLIGEDRAGFGFHLRGRVNELGYGAIAVPAALRAYADAHAAWGRMPWGDLLETAIRYAADGWVVRPGVVAYWGGPTVPGLTSGRDRLGYSTTGRALYCRPDGTPKVLGDEVRNPDLAATLTRIAELGADDFYTGETAARIVADMSENGGLVTARDLAEFRTRRTPPLEFAYRDRRMTSNRPPGGGVVLGEMLQILNEFDLSALGHNSPDYIVTVAEAMKRATIDKDALLGDPAFVDVPLEMLLDPGRARELADGIRRGDRADVVRLPEPVPRDTTHVSVIDAEGNCVAMTHSLGAPSGVVTDGLGFMYNGCMAVFDPRPDRPGSIAPGKARFSAMCPTIVFRDDRPEIVIGAPGGTQITMSVLQVLLNAIDFGMSMTEAVSAARFSATSNPIDLSNRISRRAELQVQARGYETVRLPLGFAFGAVHAIRITPQGLDGGADPGRDGVAMSTA
jgi:gamma-glutamyltranspeptidase/glutathione hydrolase